MSGVSDEDHDATYGSYPVELSARRFPCPLRKAADVLLGRPGQNLALDYVALNHRALVGVIVPGSHYGRPELGDLPGVISLHRSGLHSRPTQQPATPVQ